MIKNVNLLQNPIEYDKYVEEYLIQALANLGQRVGIKGDGISYEYFTFNELIGNTTYSPQKYLGFIQYKKTDDSYKSSFGICEYDNETGKIFNENIIAESLNIDNILYFPNDLTFDIILGGVEKYAKNSICINDGTDLTFMLVGKQIGTNDNDDLNSILYYYKFDINSNILKYGAKIYYDHSDENGDEWFYLIRVINKSYKDNNFQDNILSEEYDMHFNIFNAKVLKELDKSINNSNTYNYYNSFKTSFNFNSYKASNNIPFSLIRPEYNNIDELLSYNEDVTNNFSSNSPIAIILNYLPNTLYDYGKINLIYNSNNNEFFAIDSNEFEKIISLFKTEYNINLSEELYLLNEDCINLYHNIFSYYNEKYYFETRSSFIKRILSKLYENISDYKYNQEFRLYIPLNYQFHYICNSNDNMHIYYSTNTYVTFVNLSSINTSNFWQNNTNLIFDYNKDISKVKIYNFEINYNNNDKNFINSIIIKDIFTMPYINANSNWSINDTDTKIQAIGKDAGNPNIILIYNKDKNEQDIDKSFYLLNAITNSKDIKGADYEIKWFNVNPALFENTYTINIKCCAYIPQITKNNFESFKNSIILSISDLNCLEDESYKYYYKGSYIMTFWHVVETTNDTYEFKCINNIDTEYALALGSTVNLANTTSDETVANLNEQDLVLLKAIITELGHERLAVNENNWLIIKNKQSEEYSNIYENIGQYLNDLNAIIQFNDTVKLNNNHIQYSQTNKYISSLNNIHTTNSLYPKYYKSSTIVTKTVEETIRELRNIGSNISSQRITKVYVNGAEVQNIESLIQSIESNYDITESTIENVIQIEQTEKSNYNYNEFIFNENVPTLDFGEVFNRNFNVLNRLNIVSLDTYGNTYNAYIGTSFDEQEKSTLHIGSSNNNINIGSETLIDELEKSKFNIHDSISIDFNNIVLNASKRILSKQNILYQSNINGIIYNIMTIPLIGLCGGAYSNALFTADTTIVSGNITVNDLNNVSLYKLSLYNLFQSFLNVNLPDNERNIELNIQNIKNILYDNNGNRIQYPLFNNDMYYINKHIIDINNERDRIHILFNKDLMQTRNNIGNNVIYCGHNLSIMYYTVYDDNLKSNKYYIYLSIN